jgi:hypothetical protein
VIPWKSYLVNSELYLAIAQAFMPRERERGRSSLLALLERDREFMAVFINQTVIRAVSIRTSDCIEQFFAGYRSA